MTWRRAKAPWITFALAGTMLAACTGTPGSDKPPEASAPIVAAELPPKTGQVAPVVYGASQEPAVPAKPADAAAQAADDGSRLTGDSGKAATASGLEAAPGAPAVSGASGSAAAPKADTAAGKAGSVSKPDNAAGGSMQQHEKKPAASSGIEADRTALSWYYMKKKKGEVPNFPPETKKYTPDMKALWVGTGKKVYLTIDAGGPMGDMELLRKSLKDNDAKANFFIAGYNMKKYPDFIRQLADDGHLIANHTMTHTDMNLQTDEQVKKEIEDFAKLYKEVTGKDVPPYFRFPYGRYNMHLLKYVSDMGYTSVFWSTAMVDWLPRKNGPEDPLNDILNGLHDGNIILMHEGSPENIEALDSIIKKVREAGYEFGLISEIESPTQ
ncbi:polysaccharide deacetylase family protein [Paenibacillus hamazuiensis]|uniref:polysaccharide deacetylase family protein n=1 Tax=Paenibacillus hamazuiensis TaxID=2936508 RepID=UPI002010313D|nr:polysaccharide deacetylase family protein [Paenibacillus hamazuiensis]